MSLTLATTACPHDKKPDIASPEAPSAQALDRKALADKIDPGQQRPLSADLPDVLLAAIGTQQPMPQDRAELVRLAEAELDAFHNATAAKDLNASLALVLGLARAAIYAERAVASGARDTKTLAVLERAYNAIDAPVLVNDRSLFARLLQTFVAMMAQQGQAAQTTTIDAIAQLVFSTVQRAGPAHRHTVAELLRNGDDPQAIADALERVAPKLRKDDDALGVAAMQASIELRGDALAPKHLVALANVCHEALDLACGGDALARANAAAKTLDDAAKKDLEPTLTAAATTAANAKKIVALRDAKALADRLQQAELLLELGRHRDAKAAYERLRADFPREAGPVVGLARHALVADFDFTTAAAIIDKAGDVEHEDLAYYEVAIGVRATALVQDILPRAVASRGFEEAFAELRPIIEKVRSDIVAYEALGADKGVVLRFLVDMAMNEAIPAALRDGMPGAIPLVRGLLARAQKLQRQVPKSPHAFLLLVGSAQFAADKAAAFAALDTAPPDDPDGALALRRALARFELAATWDDARGLATLRQELEALRSRPNPAPAKLLLADALALAARMGEGGIAWPAVETAYRDAIGDPNASTDARALNNLAVAIAEQGRTDDAMNLWGRAVAASDEGTAVAKINLAATRGESTDVATIADMAENADTVDAQLLAHAWKVARASKRDRAKARRDLAAAIAKHAPDAVRPRLLPGKAGVILAGTLNIGVGYSTIQGLQLEIDTASKPWLAMRPAGLPITPL